MRRAIAGLALLALLTQGCYFTRATVGLAKAPARPAEFVGGHRTGDSLTFAYRALVKGDETKQLDEPDERTITLSDLAWEPVGGPIATQCRPEAFRGSKGRIEVPLAAEQALREADVAAVHLKNAAGTPPLSMQRSGDDLWLYCGSQGDVARAALVDASKPSKTAPGAVVAVVVLMPFALVADATVGLLLAWKK